MDTGPSDGGMRDYPLGANPESMQLVSSHYYGRHPVGAHVIVEQRPAHTFWAASSHPWRYFMIMFFEVLPVLMLLTAAVFWFYETAIGDGSSHIMSLQAYFICQVILVAVCFLWTCLLAMLYVKWTSQPRNAQSVTTGDETITSSSASSMPTDVSASKRHWPPPPISWLVGLFSVIFTTGAMITLMVLDSDNVTDNCEYRRRLELALVMNVFAALFAIHEPILISFSCASIKGHTK